MKTQELTELFRKLGAPHPEGWASSQIERGSPQLARYLFLRQAWRQVVSPDDRDWMREVQPADPNGPGGELRPAIDRLLAAGGQLEDLTTVVRVMQWWLLAGLCILLEDPGAVEDEVADIWWQLYLIDENDEPIEPITSLLESLLATDPTGREMGPPQPSGPSN